MKKIIAILLLMGFVGTVAAHGGRTDSNGCHQEKRTGTRHCH
jgi:hypothetical protein